MFDATTTTTLATAADPPLWPAQAVETDVRVATGLVALVLSFAAVVLGLYISYQAYRGYRRNRSRPMLFLSVGLILLTVVPALFSTLAANVEGLAGSSVVLALLSRICGLLSILYGIKYA